MEILADLEARSVQSVVTSPPYWGLRDYSRCECNSEYQRRGENHPFPEKQGGTILQREPSPDCPKCHGTGKDDSLNVIWDGEEDCEHAWGEELHAPKRGHPGNKTTLIGTQTASIPKEATVQGAFCSLCDAWRGQLGLEPTPKLYVQHIVEVFREVRRVLRDDGTIWLNMGDCYASQPAGNKAPSGFSQTRPSRRKHGVGPETVDLPASNFQSAGLKPKDLVGMPWRLAFALQADGWWLRSDIIWAKPNPMPESVTDRPTRSHEYIFLLTKKARYFYDADAVREQASVGNHPRTVFDNTPPVPPSQSPHSGLRRAHGPEGGRNKRTVWEITTQPYPEAHFATFPEALVAPCVRAGTPERGACSVCGSPWERIVERTIPIDAGRSKDAKYPSAVLSDTIRRDRGGLRRLGQAYQDQLDANPPKTTGFRPTCDHLENPCQYCRTSWVTRAIKKRVSTMNIRIRDERKGRLGEKSGLHGLRARATKEETEDYGKEGYREVELESREPACQCGTFPAIVLDPFCGSGTTGVVALKLGRRFIGVDVKEEYLRMAHGRLDKFPVRLDRFE